MGKLAPPLTVIIPAYNEQDSVVGTVTQICRVLDEAGGEFEVLVVDDRSTDATLERLLDVEHPRLRVLRHGRNRGYGAALKTGILAARTPLIAITDADGTYPNQRIPELAARMGEQAMVVGARTGGNVHIPLLRRPPKWVIGVLANYLSQCRIPDLNSGLRVMRREVLLGYLHILPDGFSFTTTITLALLTRGEEVEFVPIDYAKRVGRSKIRPIRDTLNFVQLIIRTVLLFEPLRVFVPFSLLLFLGAAAVFASSAIWLPRILDTTAMLLAVGGLQILGVGMIADMINRRLGGLPRVAGSGGGRGSGTSAAPGKDDPP